MTVEEIKKKRQKRRIIPVHVGEKALGDGSRDTFVAFRDLVGTEFIKLFSDVAFPKNAKPTIGNTTVYVWQHGRVETVNGVKSLVVPLE